MREALPGTGAEEEDLELEPEKGLEVGFGERIEPPGAPRHDALGRHEHDLIVANYANADMVGHTGVWSAAVEAANVLDACFGRLSRAALGERATLVITADHGNIEEMRDEAGAPQTKHTTSPVPLVLVSEDRAGVRLRDGELADVAPTLCELLGIPAGPEMTGRSLIV